MKEEIPVTGQMGKRKQKTEERKKKTEERKKKELMTGYFPAWLMMPGKKTGKKRSAVKKRTEDCPAADRTGAGRLPEKRTESCGNL
ncbi:hypothetical protein J5839_04160 [Methanosarcinaceae archaeon]|nr:hypothetical protein [Methanosarcinaceae archaeon]